MFGYSSIIFSNQQACRLPRFVPDDGAHPALGAGTVLSTDGNPGHPVVAANLGIESGGFVAGYHGHGGCGVWHTQSVHAYDSRVKVRMRSHGVATQYLHHYLGWHRLLDRFKVSVTG
ncbi:hypothetical protein ANRL1_02704 [Anaerolineae bacterium]|nr:hypothetical protein ANRL1_02704 [Anaerolineae bacterium]